MKVIFLCLFCLLFNSLAVNANELAAIPSLSTISDMAEEEVRNKIQVEETAKVSVTVQNIDGRLTPPRCYPPIKAELASERDIARNNTVKISCNTPDYDYPWQMYLSVRVEIAFPVVVAAEVIAPNSILLPEMLTIEYIDQYSLRGQFFAQTNQVSGTRVKRRIAKNAPILNNQLCFVCKGDAVSIYAKTDNLEIKTLGEALKDGNIGESITIKNINSNKQIEATVVGVGEVVVRM